jgi:hypothetical protein
MQIFDLQTVIGLTKGLVLFYNSRWFSKKYREEDNAQSSYKQRCINQSFHNKNFIKKKFFNIVSN